MVARKASKNVLLGLFWWHRVGKNVKIGGTKQCCVPILDCRNASKTGTVFFYWSLLQAASDWTENLVYGSGCSHLLERCEQGGKQDAGHPESPETVPEVCTHYQGIRQAHVKSHIRVLVTWFWVQPSTVWRWIMRLLHLSRSTLYNTSGNLNQREFYTKNILDETTSTTECKNTRNPLHQRTLTPNCFYTRRLLHQNLFTPGHLKLFNKKSFTPENLYRKGHFTPNGVNTRRLLPRSIYIYVYIYNLFEVAHRYVSI